VQSCAGRRLGFRGERSLALFLRLTEKLQLAELEAKQMLKRLTSFTCALSCVFLLALHVKTSTAGDRGGEGSVLVEPDGPHGPRFRGDPVEVERPYYWKYARPYQEAPRTRMVCTGGGWVWSGGWGLLDRGWGYYPPTPDYVYVPERCVPVRRVN
jgi:hypothetical protein